MEANRPTVCFDLCKYKKSETDLTLYHLYNSELLESFTDYTHISTDGSKDGDKTISKRLPDKASIFTAELEVIVSDLRYIQNTTKINTFVIFRDSKSALQALLSKSDHPTVQTIMRFLVFLHTVHITVIFVGFPVIWEFLETNVLILQRKRHYRRMFLIVEGEPPPECLTCNFRLTHHHHVVSSNYLLPSLYACLSCVVEL